MKIRMVQYLWEFVEAESVKVLTLATMLHGACYLSESPIHKWQIRS